MSNFLVLGGGMSGLDAARLLVSQGHQVLLSDKSVLGDATKESLLALKIQVHEGSQDYHLLQRRDGIVLSPGVPYESDLLDIARQQGIPLYSEIDYALQFLDVDAVIGVTGTNGKSTICMMSDHILRSHGQRTACLGNIGVSLSSVAGKKVEYDELVLELSSYQLEHSHSLGLSSAVFSTFSCDHLARHKTLYNYFAAKWKIISLLRSGGTFVTTLPVIEVATRFNLDFPATCRLIVIDYPEIFGSFQIPRWLSNCTQFDIITVAPNGEIRDQNRSLLGDLGLSGQIEAHNRLNALLSACCVAPIIDKSLDCLLQSLPQFQHLPFRCQKIAFYQGNPIINDSKSTNVESAISALQSQDKPVILLLGGKPKGESYAPLLQLKHHIKQIFAFGEAGPTISAELQNEVKVTQYETLRSCLNDLFRQYSRDPSPILFSPACASFDEFDNFEHRGHFFNSMIERHFGKPK